MSDLVELLMKAIECITYIVFTKKDYGEFDPEDIRKNKFVAALYYFPVCFIILLIPTFFMKSRFIKFHATQSIYCYILDIICLIIFKIFDLSIIALIIYLLLLLAGFINALYGYSRTVRFVGKKMIFKW